MGAMVRNLTYLEHRTPLIMADANEFTAEDRKALIGLIVEVRLRFDNLEQRLSRFDQRLARVEEISVTRVECGRVEHETATRLDRLEQIRVDAETLKALDLRVQRVEADRATRADVERVQSAAEAARNAVEQAKDDLQALKNRVTYMSGITVGAVAMIEFLLKVFWK
jgi:hypothetical protein